MSFWGITARNDAQKAAARVLLNEKPYLFLTGRAGTGKTLIAEAVGLNRVVEEQDFRKLVYTRLQTQLGEDLGFLPGDVNVKTYPFIRPFLDNLEVMSGNKKEQVLQYITSGDEKKRKVFFDPIQTMRGGSFHDSFIMVDEAQNLDIGTTAGVATRLAAGSKMIFLGNFSQIDNPKARTPEKNGLFHFLSGLHRLDPDQKFFDHINFTEIERHPAIELVERILRDDTLNDRFAALEARGDL